LRSFEDAANDLVMEVEGDGSLLDATGSSEMLEDLALTLVAHRGNGEDAFDLCRHSGRLYHGSNCATACAG
jgi:hypothetical protein